MRRVFDRLSLEYRRGGLRHLVVGGLEKSFITALERSETLYWTVAPQYYRWRASNDVYSYQCPPDPFKVEFVDPDRIKQRTGRTGPEHLNRRTTFGKVLDGEWDKRGIPFCDTDIYRVAKKRFVEDVAWEEIEHVRQVIDEVENGKRGKNYTRKDVLERYREFGDLYRRITEEGYRSQREILTETGGTNDGLYLDTLNEVTVDVGRDGQLLHVDGIHRLSIAKILELDEIPVVYLVRHKDWMKHREELCESDESIPDHPDLRDLK